MEASSINTANNSFVLSLLFQIISHSQVKINLKHQTIVITATSLLSLSAFAWCLFSPNASKFNIGFMQAPFVTSFHCIVRQGDFCFTCRCLNHCCHFPHHLQRQYWDCTYYTQWIIAERVENGRWISQCLFPLHTTFSFQCLHEETSQKRTFFCELYVWMCIPTVCPFSFSCQWLDHKSDT